MGSLPEFSFRDFTLLVSSLREWSSDRMTRAGILAVLAALAEVFGMIALVPLVTLAVGGHSGRAAGVFFQFLAESGLASKGAQIAACLALFLGVMLVRTVIVTARESAYLRIQTGFTAFLQTNVMRQLAAAPWPGVEALRHARITQALGPDVLRAASSALMILQIFGAVLVLILQWSLALILAPAIAIFAVLLFAVASLGFTRSLINTGRIGNRINQHGISLIHIAQQFLGGLKLAKAQNAEAGFTADFEHVTQEVLELRTTYQLRQIRMRQGLTFAATAAAGMFLLVGKWAGIDSARLLASFAILTRMSSAGTLLVQLSQQLALSLPSHTSLVHLVRELADHGGTQNLAIPASSAEAALPDAQPQADLIRLDHVSYQVGQTARVEDVSLKIAGGDIVALTGESGAGKTTLIDLMTGLLTPTSGQISVHDKPLDAVTGKAWRDRLSYVTQETWLSNDTIRANLASSRKAVDEARIWWALEIAGAEQLVRQAEQGLDTIVNENGMRFSGGERQRLALARAILRQPEVLILDEATNAIDPESEAAIFRRLFAALPALSLILIAHRPSTLSVTNRVIHMQSGRLIRDEAL